jgi:hypothetical protein
MPPRKKRVPFGSASHAAFNPFSISDDQWEKIEREIERESEFTIPPDLRSAVVAKTQTMRWRSEARQTALSTREARRQIAGEKRTTVDWLNWTDGLPDEIRAMLMSGRRMGTV